MQTTMLLNPKGGSGKTTLATSLASCFSCGGYVTALIDHDAQGSSTRWLRVRPSDHPTIHGVAAFRQPIGVTRSWAMRVPPDTERVVVDTPAGLGAHHLADLVRKADSIVIPVLPSFIDIDAVSGFLQELGRIDTVRARRTRVAVVANRVRPNTSVVHELESFLSALDYPFIARFRDSQNYVRAGEQGLGLHELPATQTRFDRRQWEPLLGWLKGDDAVRPGPFGAPRRVGMRKAAVGELA